VGWYDPCVDWFAPIDIYCERTSPGLLAEPLNAASNAAFFVAALVLWRRAGGSVPARLLAGLVGLIGVASLSFHLFANRLTMVLDVGSIQIYLLAGAGMFLRLVGGWSMRRVWLALAGLMAVSVALPLLAMPWCPAGICTYSPAMAAMLLLAVLAYRRRSLAAPMLFAAVGLFAVALTIRQLDQPLCSFLPRGTHFIWHVLNAGVLYLTTRALMRHEEQTNAMDRQSR
jgi:hypothetical protein